MSWQAPIHNQNEEKREALAKEQAKTVESVLAEKDNVVVINQPKFTCMKCGGGWTFARMKTIECCGYTYVKE